MYLQIIHFKNHISDDSDKLSIWLGNTDMSVVF